MLSLVACVSDEVLPRFPRNSPNTIQQLSYQPLKSVVRPTAKFALPKIHTTRLRSLRTAVDVVNASGQTDTVIILVPAASLHSGSIAVDQLALAQGFKHERYDALDCSGTLPEVGGIYSTKVLTPWSRDNARWRYDMTPKPSDTQIQDVYCKREAANRLGIGYGTLHKHLIKSGLLRTVRVGNRVLIPRTEIERFLKVRR